MATVDAPPRRRLSRRHVQRILLSLVVVPTADAAVVLRKMKPSAGPLLTNRRGEPYKPSGLRSIFRRPSEKVLGKGNELTPYQLRHTFAQVASEQVPRDVLSKMLGHSDEAAARFYYEVRDDRTCHVAKSLKLHPAKAAEAG